MAVTDGDGPRAVVLDAMGVLYRHGDVLGRVLVPYLRENGCRLPEPEIVAIYRFATAGGMTTSGLWAELGLAGDGHDEEYSRRHGLTPGVTGALTALAARGLRLACLSNDMLTWSVLLRERFGLQRWIPDWFVSSQLGVRKPDPAAYRPVLDRWGLPARQVLFVDDSPPNLVTADRLGMRTVLFVSDGTGGSDDGTSPRVSTMSDLLTVVDRLDRRRRPGRHGAT